MATTATLTAPFHVDYSGSAKLCSSAGLVWFDESDCSSPKSDHIIIISKDSQGSIGGLLTKPHPSSTETVTLTTTTKRPTTATVKTTLSKPTAQATATVTVTKTTKEEGTAAIFPRAVEPASLPQKPAAPIFEMTYPAADGNPLVNTYTGAATPLKQRPFLSTTAAILFALACVVPTASGTPMEDTLIQGPVIAE